MKKIKFVKLKLLNFCGIREGEFEFGDNITVVSGRNGVGKSTLASAITYALFGTDIKGRSLDIKTLDENNNVIKDLSHEVELTLSVDESVFTLKRVLVDSWKGDSVKNTFKYFVDGEVKTAGDFKKVVDGICAEKTFRLCSSPTEFVSMPWQDQFAFLKTIVPTISYEDITDGNEKFDFIVESAKKDSVDSLIHHLKYNKKEVQKNLDQIPARLSELNKMLPEEDKWDEVASELDKKHEQLEEVSTKIASIKSGNAASVAKDGIRIQLSFANKRIANMEQSARNEASKNAEKHQSDILTKQTDVDRANRETEELKATVRECTTVRVNLTSQMEDTKARAREFADKYNEVISSKWQWNDKDSFCPHCLQPLPMNQLEKIKKESEETFKQNKADKLKELNSIADEIKDELAKSKKLLEENEEKEHNTLVKQKEAREKLSSAERELGKVKLEKPKTYEEILNEKEEYFKVKKEIEELQAKLDAPSESDTKAQEMLEEAEREAKYLNEEASLLFSRLSQKESYDKVTSRIEEVTADKQKFLEQIDELDEQIAIASEYVQKSFDILAERVNEKFSFVKWIMFQTTNDGERKPYCECSHNGVPYSKLNGAAKINAGIDIANVISNFYEVDVPMLIDNGESIQKPIYCGGQQIRLSVGDSKKLDFEYQDGSQD